MYYLISIFLLKQISELRFVVIFISKINEKSVDFYRYNFYYLYGIELVVVAYRASLSDSIREGKL